MHSPNGWGSNLLPLEIGSSSFERDPINRFQPPQLPAIPPINAFGNRFILFCSVLSITSCTLIFFNLVLQILCAILVSSPFFFYREIFSTLYRIYGIGFAVLALLCELEWTETVRSTTLLQYWGTRGLFYIFVALLTLKEYSHITWESFSKLSLVVNIISFAYLAMGCIYIFMVIHLNDRLL